jgi:geranyl-CoA carboxylase alpha subunit
VKRFDSILVANRGEIAVRVMRTARALGYRTVAVYSSADAQAPHVRVADDARLIGPPPAAESYLRVERILEAARASGARAIHPGYGFLSENAGFARAVEEAGLIFIGPPARAIELMGNKAAAKRHMLQSGVPCVPGYEGSEQSDAAFVSAAQRIGYPVMVKAAAGGGGRGMRLVHDAAGLPAALRLARSEALNAFGSDELILEKAIRRPRHVEIQVFADEQGHVIHLGERDCSVQRRHQKVIEEAPCPVMTPELRARMGASAVAAARSIGYRGAGTVEFLLDEHGEFYFLEMNTRLQVEHPVTELVCGLDLVALQIAVAQGEPLGLAQADVHFRGHAIEARLCAEDPAQGFLPASGRVLHWQPAGGDGIRTDAGVATGAPVPPFYDALLAKVVAWGETREQARERLAAALEQTQVLGVRTNRGFLVEALRRDAFARGAATTAFIEEEFGSGHVAPLEEARHLAQAAVLQFLAERDAALTLTVSPRSELLNWASHGRPRWHGRYRRADGTVDVYVTPATGDRFEVDVGGEKVHLDLLQRGPALANFVLDGRRCAVPYSLEPPDAVHLADGAYTHVLRNQLAAQASADTKGVEGRVLAIMHGSLVEVFVQDGQHVTKGTKLAVLEAMKMQHEIVAAADGRIARVAARAGAQVAAGDLLFELETARAAGPAA